MFDNQQIADRLADIPIGAIELCGVHLDPQAERERIEAVVDTYDQSGIDICGFGVHDIDTDTDVGRLCQFTADKLGADYISTHVDSGVSDRLESLVEAASESDLRLGIHNHGPRHVHDTIDDVRSVYDGYPKRLGCCVDTGHFLRSGISPEDAFTEFGNRVHAVHLKDFVDEETEVLPGDGQLDIDECLSLLSKHTEFDEPLIIEYENDPEDPTPAVKEIVDRLQDSFTHR